MIVIWVQATLIENIVRLATLIKYIYHRVAVLEDAAVVWSIVFCSSKTPDNFPPNSPCEGAESVGHSF